MFIVKLQIAHDETHSHDCELFGFLIISVQIIFKEQPTLLRVRQIHFERFFRTPCMCICMCAPVQKYVRTYVYIRIFIYLKISVHVSVFRKCACMYLCRCIQCLYRLFCKTENESWGVEVWICIAGQGSPTTIGWCNVFGILWGRSRVTGKSSLTTGHVRYGIVLRGRVLPNYRIPCKPFLFERVPRKQSGEWAGVNRFRRLQRQLTWAHKTFSSANNWSIKYSDRNPHAVRGLKTKRCNNTCIDFASIS